MPFFDKVTEPFKVAAKGAEDLEGGPSGGALNLEEPSEPSANEPVNPLGQANEKGKEKPAEPSDNEPVDPLVQVNKKVLEEASAISSLRTLVSEQAMFYQGDVEPDKPYDYATELAELQEMPKPSLLTDNVSGDGNGEGNIFPHDGEVLTKAGLKSKQSSSNSKTIIKVLGGVALTVIVAGVGIGGAQR